MIAKASLIRSARWNAGAAAGVGAFLLFLAGAHAQQQQPANPQAQQFGPRANQAPAQRQQPPKPELIATHGAWAVQCQVQPAPAGAEAGTASVRSCGMVQTAKGERQGASLILIMVKEQQEGKDVTMMRVMAPIGVYLPLGVALEIDGDAVGRVPFTRCMPQTCIAIAEASPPTLDRMKKGGTANFIIYEGPGSGMAMELSLKGFTAALDELNKL